VCRAFETNYLRPLRAIRPIGMPSRKRLPAKDQRQAQRRQPTPNQVAIPWDLTGDFDHAHEPVTRSAFLRRGAFGRPSTPGVAMHVYEPWGRASHALVYKPRATTVPPEMLNSLHFLAEKESSYGAAIARRAIAMKLARPDWAKTCPHRQKLPLGTPRPAGRPAVHLPQQTTHGSRQ
jgi:hypothetical protein